MIFQYFSKEIDLTRLANDKGYDNIGYYQDNGYNGLTFERPAFSEMQKDIHAGYINCVLVVGISRIGRNSASVSEWLNKMRLAGIVVITPDDKLYSNTLLSYLAKNY